MEKVRGKSSSAHEPPINRTVPVALSIAGSDNSAGAGIQADLKTFSSLGVYGLTAVTCVVAEVPGHVSMVHPVPADVVREQVRMLFGAFPIAAIKTGMLYSRALIEAVAEALAAVTPRPVLVVDPVMVASSGDSLLEPDAVAAYREILFPKATVVTPNLDEAGVLLGTKITDTASMLAAAEELAAQLGVAVLLKGGHLGGPEALDLLFSEGVLHEFRAPFEPGVSTHGTGCTYSAAIAAAMAHGLSLPQAVGEAKDFVSRAIAHHHRWPMPSGETVALRHW